MVNEIERAISAMYACACPSDYDAWFKLLCAIKSAGVPKEEARRWCESGEGFKPAEFESKWKSIDTEGGIKGGSLFATAFAQGWKDPSKSRAKGTRPSLPIAKPSPSPTTPVKQAASANAAQVWSRCIPATTAEPYIDRKKGKPDGLRVYPASAPPVIISGQNVAGYLVAPCWSGEHLQTVQFIPPGEGKKLFLPKAQTSNGFFTVGQITDRAYIVEGIGQAWAVNQATGAAAVVCFGAGRMATVAKTLRSQYPAARLVIVPDKGKETEAAKIAAAVSGEWVAMPDDKPGNYDANDYLQDAGAGALLALLERVKAPVMRYKLLSGADLCNTPSMRWMVRGVLPMEGLAALYGASGSGKSFLMLDIAAAVAGGDSEWFGRRVTQAPVTFVCLEGEAGTGKRVKAWSLHHNKAVPEALRFITQPFDLLSDDVADLARAVIAGQGSLGLVILDTLNRAAPGADENSSVDMGNLIAGAKELQSLTGGLVLLVHHTGKDTTKGLRGHSSLYAALDGAIEVTATDNRRAWSVAKSKDDVTGDEHPFKLEIVQVGTDDEGEEITSCVAVSDDSREASTKRRPTLSKNQKIAREVLGEPLRKSPHFGMGGAASSQPCIFYDTALEVVAERMPTDAKHRKARATAAIGGLVANGYLGMKGDWLWDI